MGPKLNFLSYKSAVCGVISAVIVYEIGNMAINQLHEGECDKHLCVILFLINLGIFTPNKKNVLFPFGFPDQGEN